MNKRFCDICEEEIRVQDYTACSVELTLFTQRRADYPAPGPGRRSKDLCGKCAEPIYKTLSFYQDTGHLLDSSKGEYLA